MTDEPLATRAAAAGVELGYLAQNGDWIESSPATIETVLALLEPAPVPPSPPEMRPLPAWAGPPAWGLSVFLQGLRSAGSWGCGDAVDLAAVAGIAAGLGADALLLNPTRAELPIQHGDPDGRIDPSPYLPSSRMFDALWVLRPDALAEAALLSPADRDRLAGLAAVARTASTERIDATAVFEAKWAAVQLLAPLVAGERREQRDRFVAQRPSIGAFADWWCHVREHGADPERWPHPPRSIGGSGAPLTTAARAEREAVICAQWWIDEQLAAVQREAVTAGMRIGVVSDLPVGVHPHGFDPWHLGDLLVRGAAVGAPPDGYGTHGQNWSQPPWHPQRLAVAECRPFTEAIRHALRHAGGIRVDHALGLFRSWWIPDGHSAADGAYVRNPSAALLAALTAEAAVAGAFVIGEDLGTVGPGVRSRLAEAGLLGTALAVFAAGPDGAPAPEQWRTDALVAISNHDLPPVAAWLSGEHLELRERLGFVPDPVVAHEEWEADLTAWRYRWQQQGWSGDLAEQSVAWHRWLGATGAPLAAVQLADAVGDRRSVNVPGTVDQYPNWRLPLCDDTGQQVTVEALAGHARLVATAAAVTEGRRSRVG